MLTCTCCVVVQRAGTDPSGLKLRAVTAELETARARLADLEDYHRVSTVRQAALVERAETLEAETLHWRQRCGPLRDRCAELEDEVTTIRAERAKEREIVETARKVQLESEASVAGAKALAEAANEAAREARAQAHKVLADSEGRWMRQGLSVMLSRAFSQRLEPLGVLLRRPLNDRCSERPVF